jgi:hypothetical protein
MAVRQEVLIKVTENNDALVLVEVTTLSDAGEVAYDFTGVDDILFWGKLGKATDDADAFAKYSVGGGEIAVIPPATNGQLTMQMLAADLAIPGVFRYHIDAVKNSRVETVMAGAFVIQDV